MMDKNPKNNPPAVLQLIPALDNGGTERGCVDVGIALQQAGWRSFIASKGGALTGELERYHIQHITMDIGAKNPFTILKNAKTIRKIIKEHDIDIIHARSRAPAWAGWLAAQKATIPFMTTFHAAYKFSNNWKRFYNCVMARGNPIIAISHFIAAHIQENYHVPPQYIEVIPRGVDVALFHPSMVTLERMSSLTKDWRVPDDAPLILLPARATRIKGHEVMIEAMKQLGDTPAICVMTGFADRFDPYTKELQEKINQHGLADKIKLVPPCRDMPAAYALAAVVAAPSIVPEGFGRVPMEAMAMGRPVVASDLGGYKETIIEGVTGILTKVGDAGALAEALRALLALTAEQRAVLAVNAMQHVHQHFTKQAMCDKTLAIYRKTLNKLAL
ncbi:MAG: glycosyltransferase [Alphaproteobacteria bacterium]